jgi:hypothetical protein
MLCIFFLYGSHVLEFSVDIENKGYWDENMGEAALNMVAKFLSVPTPFRTVDYK